MTTEPAATPPVTPIPATDPLPAPAARRGGLLPALAGGLVGAGAMAALLLAAPQLASERIVRDALSRHPELLVEASDALRARQYAPLLAARRAAIETPFHSSWRGAAKPDVVLTYYFDYACGFCRKSNPDIDRLLAEDKGLRVVYRELPILGPPSMAAARVSLAASKAGRFAAFHDALGKAGPPTEASIMAAAGAVGIAPPTTMDMEVEAELQSNVATAEALGATGTPLFIVGDKVINSAVGFEALKAAVAAARRG